MTSSVRQPLEILLFDMDGVLLEPAGYHKALQETVRRIGLALGFSEAVVGPETIAQFEAAGATSEWDSSAMCAALLLMRLWESDPEPTLSSALLERPIPGHRLPTPDFLSFAEQLAAAGAANSPLLIRAEKLLIHNGPPRPSWQNAHLREILRGAREIDRSITHRLFQELVLGSEKFVGIYNLPPILDLAGYLVTYDQPALGQDSRRALQKWLAKSQRGAAIFTNRPTLEPGGLAGTPEGELGQVTTGLQALPLIGWGQLTWLSSARGLQEAAFGKPAPAHALAALQCALGTPAEAALQAAADLQLGRESSGWEALKGAQIHAFEDGAAGLISARAAGELLEKVGIPTEINLYGISQAAPKQQALAQVGGQIFPNLAQALGAARVLDSDPDIS